MVCNNPTRSRTFGYSFEIHSCDESMSLAESITDERFGCTDFVAAPGPVEGEWKPMLFRRQG